MYPPTHKQLQCQNISFYEHPPIEHTESVTLSLYIYQPNYEQLSQYFILGTPTQPLNIHKESTCHSTFTHPPIEHPPTHQTYPKCHPVTVHVLTHPQTVTVSKYFILQTPTYTLNIQKVHSVTVHIPTHPMSKSHFEHPPTN